MKETKGDWRKGKKKIVVIEKSLEKRERRMKKLKETKGRGEGKEKEDTTEKRRMKEG